MTHNSVFVELLPLLNRINDEVGEFLVMTAPRPTDSELLKEMLAGDDEALAALYRRRQGGVYRFAMQMSGSRALYEDVTQEVFMVLMRDGSTFDTGRGSLNSFLLGIARNLVRQRLS